jgi:superfamily II DNA or RNA helicase/HKD family nuclease
MRPDGLYELLLDTATAPRLESMAAEGKATLAELRGPERRQRLIEALQRLLPDLLDEALADTEEEGKAAAELHLLNHLLASVRKVPEAGATAPYWADPLRLLQSIHCHFPPFEAPLLPLSVPWLFATGHGDPSLLSELRREMASADQVDMLVSFITWSGVRKLWDVLQGLTAVGADGIPRVRIRVLTTTYIGATELKAVKAMAELPGVEVRISLDGRRTRLHAKAWILQRRSGFGTAFVGSANLTGAALLGGLEWTVRFTQTGQGELFESAKAHFETLWNDSEFQAFDPQNPIHIQQLQSALTEEGRRGAPSAIRTWFDIQPKAYQQEMLDRLVAERRHQRSRNLLVAATGTGKTVVAAFDYRHICLESGGHPRLLFVSHRKEILVQARETYRQVLRHSDFGELLVDGQIPESFDHVFATIQSAESRNLVERFGVDHWHTVVIDECHHITAKSFDVFAKAIQPAILLGLTATPERADGESIAPYFHMRPDGSPAVELRLWEALDQQLLAPFEYYGVTDETDFSAVRWNQAGEAADLDRIVTGNHIRARRVVDAFERYASAPNDTRTLGFCVSVAHAEFMAEQFRAAGYRTQAITGGTARDLRERIPDLLARREITAIFTCDLYNEGIDLPDVDTLLLLRPTQSPVLFQQQIGRGLRLANDKTSCLILDFVGRHREEFRFDRLLQALTGLTKRQLILEAEAGFPSLPPGCYIQLEKVARDRVLENLRRATAQNWRRLTGELRTYLALPGKRNPGMAEFLCDQGLELNDLYRAQEPSGWTGLRRAAGMDLGEVGSKEGWLGKRFADLLHTDDPESLHLWQRVAEPTCDFHALSNMDQRRAQVLAYQIYPDHQDTFGGLEFLRRLQTNPRMAEELKDVATWLDEASLLDPKPLPGAPDHWPLRLHGAYDIREILTAVGHATSAKRPMFREGVLPLKAEKIELLFVTLDKREGYHAGIAYHDYAISPDLFHWQTQNSAGPDTAAGKRYLESDQNGWQFQLFVREAKGLPYRALGPVKLVATEGNRPMSVTWRLETSLPLAFMHRFSVIRSGA